MALAEARLDLIPLTWTRAGVLVFIAAVVVFANAVLCGWSNLDDPLYVLGNPRILDTTFDAFLRLWSFEHAHMGNFVEYFPLRDSVYWIIHRFFGINPMPYHLINVLLHGICSMLVVVLGRRLSFSLSASFCAGLIFAVHPAHCESVVWISALKDPMFTGFILASIVAYEPNDFGKRFYVLSFIFFVLSMLCKSIGFLLPALLLALEWRRKMVTRTSVIAILPFAIVALLFLVNFVLIGRSNNVITNRPESGAIGSFLTSMWCIVVYISIQFMPLRLYLFHVIPSVSSLSDLRGAIALGICVGIAIGFVGLLVKSRKFAFLGIWFLLFLLPVLNIVPIPVFLAERYLYLPSVAFALAVGAGIAQAAMRHRAFAHIVALVIVIAFATRAVVRNEDWRGGDVALWQGVVTQPTTARFDAPWLLLGQALLREKRAREGEEALLRAIEIQEQNDEGPTRRCITHAYLGVAYLEAKKLDLARHHLAISLAFNSTVADVWNSMSLTEAESGNPARAEHAANMAVQLDPSFANARYNRGLSRMDLGRVDEGVADLERAMVDEPDMCHKLVLWLKAVGEIPVAARVRKNVAPRCPSIGH